jgi:hypothetical protein
MIRFLFLDRMFTYFSFYYQDDVMDKDRILEQYAAAKAHPDSVGCLIR